MWFCNVRAFLMVKSYFHEQLWLKDLKLMYRLEDLPQI